jgi:hypothetical protein
MKAAGALDTGAPVFFCRGHAAGLYLVGAPTAPEPLPRPDKLVKYAATADPSRSLNPAQSFTWSSVFDSSSSEPCTECAGSAKKAFAARSRSSEQPRAMAGMKTMNIGGTLDAMVPKFSVIHL